jgi:hypothetical protein
MSEHKNQDTLPISQDTTSTTPARKSAAKKTAAKKSAVKKVAAKKTTARKAKTAEPELPALIVPSTQGQTEVQEVKVEV